MAIEQIRWKNKHPGRQKFRNDLGRREEGNKIFKKLRPYEIYQIPLEEPILGIPECREKEKGAES